MKSFRPDDHPEYRLAEVVLLSDVKAKLKMYEDFNNMDDDGEWEPPHPIFLLTEENDKLRAQLEAAENEANTLAMALWKRHYRKESPDFELCDSVAGVISQIDNMSAGISNRVEELEAQLAKYGWHQAGCPCFRTENDCEICSCGFIEALENE